MLHIALLPLCIFFLLQTFILCGSTYKPNIIIFYIENINEVIQLAEKRVYDSSVLPNIYNTVQSSVRFHNVYGEMGSASNFASLITGKPAVDLGIIQGKLLPFNYFPSLASTGGLKSEEITIAEHLQNHGYRTWFTGYWKLGLGENADMFPTKHGFDTWMGVAHPHNEWCHRKKGSMLLNSPFSSHPYVTLLYKTSFIWTVILLLLTTLAWFRVISAKLYVNLLIYTICTSVAFYVLSQFFMIQRSASCVLYYHDTVYQQPYEQNNLTLHLTKHMSKLINIVNESDRPFFTVLNYVKMAAPYFHSDIFRTKSTDVLTSALLELDWSVGVVLKILHDLEIYDKTTLILTGSTHCDIEDAHAEEFDRLEVYERNKANSFVKVEDTKKTSWRNCFKVPLYIKDNTVAVNKHSHDIYNYISITDVFETIVDISLTRGIDIKDSPNSLQSLYKQHQVDYHTLTNYMYNVVTKLDNENNATLTDMKRNWVIESSDDETTIEALETLNSEEDIKIQTFKSHVYLFHYYNIYKPVMVTYKARYQVVFKYLDGFGSLQTLPLIRIIDLKQEDFSNHTTYSHHYEEVYNNVTAALKFHAIDRQNKNPWTSQFEMPVYPWLLPCVNFPYCKTMDNSEEEDFTDILKVEDIFSSS